MSESSPPSAPAIVTFAASPLTATPAAPLATVMLSSPAVPLTITLSAARSPWPLPTGRQVDVDLRGVGSGEVVDRDGVGAAQGVDLDVLDAVDVHGTLPTSRDSRTREPLAEMSMFSATLEPLNTSVSVPAWPSTTSLPSPGFQTNVSLPLPRNATSLPLPPITVSLPSPPSRMSLPWLPVMVSLPAPPSMVRPMTPAGREDALIVSLPAPPLTVRMSAASGGRCRPAAGARSPQRRSPWRRH